MNELFDFCRKTAVSGNEYEFSKYLKEKIFDEFCDETSIDNIGNLIAVINKGESIKIMIEAHIDEIGLMVKSIDDNGFVHFAPIGGIDASILPSMEVTIHGKKNILGIIGAKPPHLQNKEERKKAYTIDDLYIDIGYTKEDALENISVGDVISFISEPIDLLNNLFSSKSIDDRMGVYVVYQCLKKLKDKKIDAEIIGLCAVQEEVGDRGATVGGYTINPDYVYVIDVTHATSPYVDKTYGYLLGNGVAIGVGPNLHGEYTKELILNCRALNIPHTIEILSDNSGTDAWTLQTLRNGIPCMLLSAPLRYMHTNVETVSKDDINSIIDAICTVVEGGESNNA